MNKKTIAYTRSLRTAHALHATRSLRIDLILHAAFGLLAALLLLLLAACQPENDQLLPPDPNPVGPNSTILDPDPDGGNLRLTTPIVALDANTDAGSTRSTRTDGTATVPYDAMTLQIRLLSADGNAYRQAEATYTYTANSATNPDGSSTNPDGTSSTTPDGTSNGSTSGTWTLAPGSTAPAVSAPGTYRIRALARILRHADRLPMLAYFDGTTTISTDGSSTNPDGSSTAPDGTTTARFTLRLRPATAQLRLRLKDINGRIITDGTPAALRATNPDLKDAPDNDPTLLARATADEATFDALQTYENALWHALPPTHIFTSEEADAFDPKPDTETAWAPTATALPLDNEYYTTPTLDASNIATAPLLRRSPAYLSDAHCFVLADVYPNGTSQYSGSTPGGSTTVGIPGSTPLIEVTHLGKTYTVTLPSGATPLKLAAGTITTLTVSLGATDATVEEIEIADMDEDTPSIGISNSDICIIGNADNGQPIYAIYNEKGLMEFAHIVMGTKKDGSVGDGLPREGANLAACGRLMADIYLSEPDPTNGSNWTPLGNYSNGCPYTGTFDGGGHTVFGLVINRPDAGYQGFFGGIGSSVPATVKNLTVEGTVTGKDNTGGIVGITGGSSSNPSHVENCVSRVKVKGEENVGGVVGNNAHGILRNCRNEGSVESTSGYVGGVVGDNHNSSTIIACINTGSVMGTGDYVGGVVGNNSSTITACINTGSVEGKGYDIGGVVGGNSSSLTACISTGSVKGTGTSSNIGGVVGNNYSATITTCYWQTFGPSGSRPEKGVGSSGNFAVTSISFPYTDASNTTPSWFAPATTGDTDSTPAAMLNTAIGNWNPAHTNDGQACPYRFAPNPAYPAALAAAGAASNYDTNVPPLLLVPAD